MRGAPPGGPHERQPLPPRRPGIHQVLAWKGRDWLIGFGFDPDGRVKEVFADGHKTGTDMEGMLDDGCILLSVLLQMGVPPAELSDRLSREGADPAAAAVSVVPPASPLGLIAGAVVTVEAECGEIIREVYPVRLRRPMGAAQAGAGCGE